MMYAVRPRPDWLDVGDKPEPIAWFVWESHAHKFGQQLYGRFYEVEQVDAPRRERG